MVGSHIQTQLAIITVPPPLPLPPPHQRGERTAQPTEAPRPPLSSSSHLIPFHPIPCFCRGKIREPQSISLYVFIIHSFIHSFVRSPFFQKANIYAKPDNSIDHCDVIKQSESILKHFHPQTCHDKETSQTQQTHTNSLETSFNKHSIFRVPC